MVAEDADALADSHGGCCSCGRVAVAIAVVGAALVVASAVVSAVVAVLVDLAAVVVLAAAAQAAPGRRQIGTSENSKAIHFGMELALRTAHARRVAFRLRRAQRSSSRRQ